MRLSLLASVFPLVAALPPTGHGRQTTRSPGGHGNVLTYPGSSTVDYESFQQKVLKKHNDARAKHKDTEPLKWDERLADDARRYSAECKYKHGHSNLKAEDEKWGQNIASATLGQRVSIDSFGRVLYYLPPSPEDIDLLHDPIKQFNDAFFNWWEWERFFYDWNTYQVDKTSYKDGVLRRLQNKYPDHAKKTVVQIGHFTQIIWKETTRVGCAVTVCKPLLGSKHKNTIGSYTVCNYAKGGNIRLLGTRPPEHEYTLFERNVNLPKDWQGWWDELYTTANTPSDRN